MVNIDTGKYVALNVTATAVWAALETPADQAAIERRLCEAFEVTPEDCRRSVDALLETMRDLKLVSPL